MGFGYLYLPSILLSDHLPHFTFIRMQVRRTQAVFGYADDNMSGTARAATQHPDLSPCAR